MMPRLLSALLLLLCLRVQATAQLKFNNVLQFVAASPSEGSAFARFTFKNAGTYPVKITGTRTTCGCTAAVTEQRLFAPGEEGEIKVTFKTINRHGLYGEPVIVKTDDPQAPETELKLRVLVREVLEVQPELVFWKPREPLAPKTVRVTVTEGFDVKGIEAASQDANVDVHMKTIKPGHEYEVAITPKTSRMKAKVTIKPDYSASDPKVFTVHVRAG